MIAQTTKRTTEERTTIMSQPFGEIIHEVKRNPWKLGVLYVDPDDRRLIVRQRTGLGWTLNLGQPLSWVLVGAFVGIMFWRRSRR